METLEMGIADLLEGAELEEPPADAAAETTRRQAIKDSGMITGGKVTKLSLVSR